MRTNIEEPMIDRETISNICHYNKGFLDTQKFPKITSYCLIRHLQDNFLSISFYMDKNSSEASCIIFKAKSAEVLCKLISSHAYIANVLSPSHALYIGMELMKAELTMITKQRYTQN